MSLWEKLRGTLETIFQIGLSGPQLKNNAGAIEVRNSTDTGFAIARGATAVSGNDLVTFAQLPSGGGLTAPVVGTVRTNTTHSIWTFDTTGGGPDFMVVHNRTGQTAYVWPGLSTDRFIDIKDKTGAIQTVSNNITLVPSANEKIDNASPFALTGTAYNFTNGSPNVTATGSKFTSELAVGMSIQSSNQSGVNYIITGITTDTALTITPNFSGTTTAAATSTRTSLTYSTNNGCLRIFTDGTDLFTC